MTEANIGKKSKRVVLSYKFLRYLNANIALMSFLQAELSIKAIESLFLFMTV